jgi:nicotinate-nucleotide adenylyltransferase
MRLGMFGGAFDPPHQAHVALAEAALHQYQLDGLVIVPTGQAWHKSRHLTAASHRVAMTRLAFAHLPRVRIDVRETLQQGPSYTHDTLRALQQETPGSQWFLFVGSDQARAFTTWHRWQDILRLATLVVADRAEAQGDLPPLQWHNAASDRIAHLEMPRLDVSATALRQRLVEHRPTDLWLNESVQRYIQHHHLYKKIND